MQYLPCTGIRHRLARIAALIVLLNILSVGASAGNVTSTYSMFFNIGTDGFYEPQLLPIAGFDSSLGQFDTATVNLTMVGFGIIGYRCAEPYGVGGSCGHWSYDPSTGESTWVPNLYPYPLPWGVGVYASIFPESFLLKWLSPEWFIVPRVDIINGGRSFLSSPGVCGEQWFCLDGTLAFTETSSDPIFAADPRLMAFFNLGLGVDTQNPETYQFTTGYFSGDMTLSIRYDFQPVPEPNLTTMTFLALLSMLLLPAFPSPCARRPKHR